MIAQRKLSLLSNRLARDGGRRIPEAVLERDYCLAWFLVGLSRAPLREFIAFKGGTALKRCYFGDYRFSEDLDFTLTVEMTLESLREHLEPVFKAIHEASGIAFRFDREDRQTHTNSHTFYLAYEGPLAANAPRQVKVDITLRELLALPLVERSIVRGYDEYEDLPDEAKLRTYSLEEIAVEKSVALGDRARNEPRDLFDIWFLTAERHVELSQLKKEVQEKLAFRGRTLKTLGEEFLKKKARLERLWKSRLSAQIATLPEFEGVFRSVTRSFRQAGLLVDG